jgi:uncharacterized protein (DUF2384 family)
MEGIENIVDYSSIGRVFELVSRFTVNSADAQTWLNSPHPDLGERTPLYAILEGYASAVVCMLENALMGIPT